ncbi:hypothetical protein ACGRHW_40895 [Streptomyces noursei]|uniref:hypothetical protein n=1 Tax=Streptomyces noursei TaxID=1971 RepID=UPI0037518766
MDKPTGMWRQPDDDSPSKRSRRPTRAVLDAQRGYLIPVEDLIDAGFHLNATPPPKPKYVGAANGSSDEQCPSANHDHSGHEAAVLQAD